MVKAMVKARVLGTNNVEDMSASRVWTITSQ